MTKNEFIAKCSELLIDPAVALEDDEIREALINHDDEAVELALLTKF